MNNDAKKIGPVLRAMREEAGLTQRMVAEGVGLSQGRISQIEDEDNKGAVDADVIQGYLEVCGEHGVDLVLRFLEPQSEEAFADLALRALGLGSPAGMPPEVLDLAIEGLVHHRRAVRALLEATAAAADESEDLVNLLEIAEE